MADKTKILSSPATLLIGDKGKTPTNVGYTRGGVSITKTYDTRTIEADQTRFPLFRKVTSEGYEINFRLLEITPQNLRLGWGEAGEVSGNTLSLGVYSENPVSKTIQIYAKNMAGQIVKFTFYDCVLTSTGALNYSKDEEALIEATFTATFDDEHQCVGLFEIQET